jgi:hypothetical protein
VGDLSSYAFSPLRAGELPLYRGSGQGLPPILMVAAENASLASLDRLEHEYALRADLDAAWAAHPIEISRHHNRLALLLEDPGGVVLDRLLSQPLGITEQEAKNRFQMVFRRFLGVFAHKEHPLALFLDDLQWLDSATLDLLEHLVTHSEVRHLLLVGAYRDNEVGPSHPLMRTLEAIRDTDARVHEIVLAPLGLGDVGRLIADALHCTPERAQTLAELVAEKTAAIRSSRFSS